MLLNLRLLILFFFSTNILAEKITVFYPTTIPPKKIEKNLKSLGDPIVFAKYRDFRSFVKKEKPKYVISSDMFGSYNSKYKKIAVFHKKNKTTFNYVLLSLNKNLSPNNLKSTKVGIVSMGSKKHTRSYLQKIFSQKFKGVKTVSKPEDLFPLLVFKSVDSIALSPDNYKDLKSKFSAKVFEITKSKSVSYPTVYSIDGSAGAIKKKLLNINLKNIDFDGIQL